MAADEPPPPSDAVWIGIAAGLYGPVALGSAAWLAWRHGPEVLAARTVGIDPLRDVGLGLMAGLAVVAVSRLGHRMGWARQMEASLRRSLGQLSLGTCVLLALLSSAGEEMLFRAVLQPAWGLIPATLAFAAAHVPVERELVLWPLFAFAIGLLLGGLFEVTGAALAPAVTHFVINALNLRWLTRPAA